jgi:hypothetical protein
VVPATLHGGSNPAERLAGHAAAMSLLLLLQLGADQEEQWCGMRTERRLH